MCSVKPAILVTDQHEWRNHGRHRRAAVRVWPGLVGHDLGAVGSGEGDVLAEHAGIVGGNGQRRKRHGRWGGGGLLGHRRAGHRRDPELSQHCGGGGHATGDIEDPLDHLAAGQISIAPVVDEFVDEIAFERFELSHFCSPSGDGAASSSCTRERRNLSSFHSDEQASMPSTSTVRANSPTPLSIVPREPWKKLNEELVAQGFCALRELGGPQAYSSLLK